MDPIAKKQLEDLKRDTKPDVIAANVLDTMFKRRVSSDAYASTGGSRMIAATQMLEVRIRGERYVIPVYKTK
jgi:hypothetical protein